MRSSLHTRLSVGSRTAFAACERRISSRGLQSCKVQTKPDAAKTDAVPEWVPEPLAPAVKFLAAEDFKLQDSDFYKTNLKQYFEKDLVQQSIGFKRLPELINARAAMIGFVAGASAEVFGAGSVLQQLSGAPQVVLLVVALITAGSIIPIVKGTEGNYLESLQDTYSVPEGVFTEVNERVIGRLALIGIGGLVFIELLKGSALF